MFLGLEQLKTFARDQDTCCTFSKNKHKKPIPAPNRLHSENDSRSSRKIQRQQQLKIKQDGTDHCDMRSCY